MNLPGRMIDLSSPLENETVYDHPFMRPKIEYLTGADTAPMLCEQFPGLRLEDLPDGEGWAFEQVQITTHNGTHMDAPYHFQSKSTDGKPMMTIDQVPLDWFFRPGVKLDFRKVPDGHVVTAAEVEAELKRIGHALKPFDIVHHYHFTVYALSVKSLDLPKDFDGPAAQDAMKGKILAQGEELGLYTQNPAKDAKP